MTVGSVLWFLIVLQPLGQTTELFTGLGDIRSSEESFLEFVGNVTWTKMCCLIPGHYTLTCKATNENGWTKAYLLINGHRFCDDFVGRKAMRDLDVSGISMNLYICTYTSYKAVLFML